MRPSRTYTRYVAGKISAERYHAIIDRFVQLEMTRRPGTRNGEPLPDCPGCDAQALLDAISARVLRLAQALRLLRDTSSGYVANVAGRALDEAGIPDPPEEDHA